jgi:acyl carrier protein
MPCATVPFEVMKTLISEKDAEAVLQILSDELGVARSQLTDDASLTEDLGADSLSLVEINMALEDRLEITIPDERADHVRTVVQLFELLSELQSHKP